jgi:hypothetical protein
MSVCPSVRRGLETHNWDLDGQTHRQRN